MWINGLLLNVLNKPTYGICSILSCFHLCELNLYTVVFVAHFYPWNTPERTQVQIYYTMDSKEQS